MTFYGADLTGLVVDPAKVGAIKAKLRGMVREIGSPQGTL